MRGWIVEIFRMAARGLCLQALVPSPGFWLAQLKPYPPCPGKIWARLAAFASVQAAAVQAKAVQTEAVQGPNHVQRCLEVAEALLAKSLAMANAGIGLAIRKSAAQN